MPNAATKDRCRFMWASHFGFGGQSELVVVPAVIVEPVTPPPMAMPPQFAWSSEASAREISSLEISGRERNRQTRPKVPLPQRRARIRASSEPADRACHARTPTTHLGLAGFGRGGS